MQTSTRTGLKGVLLRHESILLLIVLVEMVYFYAAGRNFATLDNIANMIRHSTEMGLLALVMMPIILTGGIDLSVGSLVGLCAVLFGKMCQEKGLNPWAASAATLGIGAAGGGFNALFITYLRLPPLIVTLGAYSLFRGLAEAITRGSTTYSQFPIAFLQFGNSAFLGLPTQAWILFAVALAVWVLVHRTTFGRSLRAIGFSPEGARYAGLPVTRHVAAVYVLGGLVAALAAILLTARVTQARADSGIGYELLAITAVVLGGTSIFGGIGTVHGALLGVVALAVLTNGLSRIMAITNISRELSGMLTGALLIVALMGNCLPRTFALWRGTRKKSEPLG